MGSGRIYWGQILTVLGALLLSAIVATQWVADALGYQPALGPPDAGVLGLRFYAPWKFLAWWYSYDAYARPTFETAALIFVGGIVLSILSAFGFSLWRSREDRKASTYGTARWAEAHDIARLGLTSGDGVILGEANGRILRHDGDEHVLVVAPTNTGKSVGVSLPTGLVWRGSYFTLDLKGENWAVTSGLRRSFGPVYRFAPTSEDTHRYNPLTAIRRGDSEVRDAQVLADMLVDPEGALRERSHWQLRAFELLVAAMLWTLYAEQEKSLARVGQILADPARPVHDLFADMLNRPIRDGAPHPVVAASARQMLDMAEGERSGVVSTALGCLALYRDPVLARATSASDFAIEDLVAGPRPISLYLIVPPEEMSRLKALLRLVINQLLKRLTEVAAREPNGRRVLLLLDEFPQLGRLDFFEHALAYIRGYRLKACLIAQSLNQIAQAYGEHASILDNAHVRVAFACNDERTARRISDMLGVTTETRAQMNYAGSRMAPWLGHTMVSRQEVGRPLLTPGEVMQLPPDEAVILTGGAPPIRARKIRYYAMPVFMARVRPPFASPRIDGPGLGTSWDGLALPPTSPGPANPSGTVANPRTPAPRGAHPSGGTSRQAPAQAPAQTAFDFMTHSAPSPDLVPTPPSSAMPAPGLAPAPAGYGLDPHDFEEEF